MEVEVYADLLFLINAGMDGLCFCLTGKLLHRKLSLWRVTAGSVLGGLYAVLSLFLNTGQAVVLAADLAICVFICLVAFGGKGNGGWKRMLSATGVYFLLSMVMGGVMTALYHLLNRAGIPALLPEGEDGLGAWLFLLLTVVGGIISLCGGRVFRRSATRVPCTVSITLDGRTTTLEGMVDTGNLLRDPVGGRTVICAEGDGLTNILSSEMARALGGDTACLSSLPLAEGRRIRIIPAGTATGSGLLYGFLPDTVTVAAEGKTPHQVDAVIAIATLENVQALVPYELI